MVKSSVFFATNLTNTIAFINLQEASTHLYSIEKIQKTDYIWKAKNITGQ